MSARYPTWESKFGGDIWHLTDAEGKLIGSVERPGGMWQAYNAAGEKIGHVHTHPASAKAEVEDLLED